MLKSHNPIKHAKSFKYAFKGIRHALLNEANFRAQMLAAIIMISMGFYFDISNLDWAFLVLSMSILLSAEMFNTVIEVIIDYLFPEHDEIAEVVKDLSAGFVLISAIATIAIFILVFGNDLMAILNS